MQTRFLPFAAALLIASSLHAEGIRYDRIPDDASAYFHLDVDHLLHSAAIQHAPDAAEFLHQITQFFGDKSDITLYETRSPHAEKIDGYVLLWHSPSPALRDRVRAALTAAKNNLPITYDQQPVTFADVPPAHLVTPRSETPATPATLTTPPAEKKEPDHPNHNRIMLGLGDSSDLNLNKGPSYVAFIDPDLMVIAGTLPSMAQALDVLHAKHPSLSQHDPNNLKLNPPPGAFFLATGVDYSAEYQRDANSPTQPAPTLGGALGLDMFGTLKAKAHLARIDAGENDHDLFINASVAMNDDDAAAQLKNLILGVKGLVGLTQPKASPLLAPLDLQSDHKEVSLHWSWPVAKLGDLYTLLASQDNNADSGPTTNH